MKQIIKDLMEILDDKEMEAHESYMVFAIGDKQMTAAIRFADEKIGNEVVDAKKQMASCWSDAVNVATFIANTMVNSFSLDGQLAKEQLLGLFLASMGVALGDDMKLNNGKVLKSMIDYYADELSETSSPMFSLGKN